MPELVGLPAQLLVAEMAYLIQGIDVIYGFPMCTTDCAQAA